MISRGIKVIQFTKIRLLIEAKLAAILNHRLHESIAPFHYEKVREIQRHTYLLNSTPTRVLSLCSS